MKARQYNLTIMKNSKESSNFTSFLSENSLETVEDYHFNESYFCHINDCSILAQELNDSGKTNKYYFKIAHDNSIEKILETQEIIQEKIGVKLKRIPGSL